MAQVSTHLQQISVCSQSIAGLSFSSNRVFTNALLVNDDITTLIRDTEAHERALFHLAPPPIPAEIAKSSVGVAPISSAALKARRTTIHQARQPRSRAVVAVLGGELYAKIQAPYGRQVGEVDVDALLQGAERLATVYPIAGALDKIGQLKRRHHQLQANIAHYEEKIIQQTSVLQQLHPSAQIDRDMENEDESISVEPVSTEIGADLDWDAMQEEIKELEQKKKGLENRVTGMEKDLGGLLR